MCKETIFLLQLILFYPFPNDTTSSALFCLQYFSSFHVILLSRVNITQSSPTYCHNHWYTLPNPSDIVFAPVNPLKKYILCKSRSFLLLFFQFAVILISVIPSSICSLCLFQCDFLLSRFYTASLTSSSCPSNLKMTALIRKSTQGQYVNKNKWFGYFQVQFVSLSLLFLFSAAYLIKIHKKCSNVTLWF